MTHYACPKGTESVRDTNQTLVVDAQHGRTWMLRGEEAVIWDWLMLAYPYARMVKTMAALRHITAVEAEERLLGWLGRWRDAGLLIPMGGRDRLFSETAGSEPEPAVGRDRSAHATEER